MTISVASHRVTLETWTLDTGPSFFSFGPKQPSLLLTNVGPSIFQWILLLLLLRFSLPLVSQPVFWVTLALWDMSTVPQPNTLGSTMSERIKSKSTPNWHACASQMYFLKRPSSCSISWHQCSLVGFRYMQGSSWGQDEGPVLRRALSFSVLLQGTLLSNSSHNCSHLFVWFPLQASLGF